MSKIWRPFASYNLWSKFAPAIGQEHCHCDMKRGFEKARKKEPQIDALLKLDSIPQKIGFFAQKGIYEFHQNSQMLTDENAVEQVAEILQLHQQPVEIEERVKLILTNYHNHPILLGKRVIQLSRGDEGFPEPIPIKQGNYLFNLYAAMDCVFVEQDETIHILDFKTGNPKFDYRQGYVYLLAASFLYPKQKAVASFYNLETQEWSKQLIATTETLKAFQIELVKIAKRHQQDLHRFRKNPSDFSEIFPPNPGFRCNSCRFDSVCKFSELKLETAA